MNEAVIGASRFGYGVGATVQPPTGDVRGWLTAQLQRQAVPAAFNGLPASPSVVVAYQQLQRERKQDKGEAKGDKPAALTEEQKALRQDYIREVGARYDAALASQTPLIERLVAFWSNHFTVSGVRPVVRPLAGPFEREAIRPHVTGHFEEMALAVVSHPAMGLYLDNAVSVGPDSRAGERNHRGVNENLGRELLELHTLGVDGGYTEQDVRSLARILTGWSVARYQDPNPGTFRFYEQIHEPGAKVLLGKTYDQDGMEQGVAAIRDIARHPSTAKHIARKLAVHFIADQPSQAAIDHLAQAFNSSHGDLRVVTETLIAMPEAWSSYQQKVKTPWDLVVSASLATGIRMPPEQVVATLLRLGQPVYMAQQPSGWPDDAASWIGPDSVLRRVEWCGAFAEHADPSVDPAVLADQVLGDTLAPESRQAIARAESRPTAVAMLLASPEFQRR
jgi:uncharacterized protein (DUF1800 family)